MDAKAAIGVILLGAYVIWRAMSFVAGVRSLRTLMLEQAERSRRRNTAL
jgi:hypothetical protein